jgi:hypothetical protein
VSSTSSTSGTAGVWRAATAAVTLAAVTELAWFLSAVAVCGALLDLAHRIEPHWVAKDGSRFLTTAQTIDRSGTPAGRTREVRVVVMADGTLMVSRRSFWRTRSGIWRVQAKSPNPPRGRQLYLLRPVPDDPMDDFLTLRIPSNSRIVPILDARVPEPSPRDPNSPTLPSDRGTRRWDRRADRG